MSSKNKRDVKEFLRYITEAHLIHDRVLLKKTSELKGESIEPLIALMQRENVDILVDDKGKWQLNKNGDFKNQYASPKLEQNYRTLDHPGSVFLKTNEEINPFYKNPHK
jgi:hypothetical protein